MPAEPRTFRIPSGIVSQITFSPDGRYLAASSGAWVPRGDRQIDCVIRLFDFRTGTELRRFEGHTDLIETVSFSNDGKRLLSASWDKTARLWDVDTGKELKRFEGYSKHLTGAALSSDQKAVAVTSYDVVQMRMGELSKLVQLLDVGGGQETRRFVPHPTAAGCLALSTNGKYLLTGTGDVAHDFRKNATIPVDCRIHLWDLATGQEVIRFEPVESPIQCVAFSTDNKYILCGSGYSRIQYGPERGIDCTIRLWDVQKPHAIRRYEGHTKAVRSVEFSRNCRFVVSGSSDCTVRVWNMESGKEVERFTSAKEVSCVACSPDGKEVAACGGDGIIRIWRLSKLD